MYTTQSYNKTLTEVCYIKMVFNYSTIKHDQIGNDVVLFDETFVLQYRLWRNNFIRPLRLNAFGKDIHVVLRVYILQIST